MLRNAAFSDIDFIYSIINREGNLDKLETYSIDTLTQAFNSKYDNFLIWEENNKAQGYIWTKSYKSGIKIEEFAVNIQGQGIGTKMLKLFRNKTKTRRL